MCILWRNTNRKQQILAEKVLSYLQQNYIYCVNPKNIQTDKPKQSEDTENAIFDQSKHYLPLIQQFLDPSAGSRTCSSTFFSNKLFNHY